MEIRELLDGRDVLRGDQPVAYDNLYLPLPVLDGPSRVPRASPSSIWSSSMARIPLVRVRALSAAAASSGEEAPSTLRSRSTSLWLPSTVCEYFR